MKKLVGFFVNNSILVNFIMVYVIIVGVLATFSIRKELRPPVSIDKVVVNTVYSGASPDEVEKLVTIPLEEGLSSVVGIKRMESISAPGVSSITLEIDTDVASRFEVVQEIFRAVDGVRDLPDDAEEPKAREIKAQIIPIYGIALFGNVEDRVLRTWAERLSDRLKVIDGVNSANVTGVTDPTIDVIVDPIALQRHSISVLEIMDMLREWNKSAPGGYITQDGKEFAVRIDENFSEKEKVENLIIRTNDMGEGVKVRDVAKVKWGFKKDRKLNRYNGLKNLQITVSKEEIADTIKVVRLLEKEVDSFSKSLPSEISLKVYRNDAPRIESKLDSVAQNAIMGLVLVVIILLLMLNWRIAVVTALGLPVAFFASIWALQIMGFTLNSMTIIGIILVVGMLVDDGIVVAENIFHHFEQGKDKKQAAVDGTVEIVLPVIGTVLTTVVAFLPLAFISGVVGNFMSVIPVVVITCLTFSLVECIVLLPNHAAELMAHSSTSSVSDYLNRKLEGFYRPILNATVRKRWITAPVIFVLVIGLTIYHVKTFRMQMFPTQGITSFSFNVEGPANTQLERSNEVISSMEKVLQKRLGDSVEAFDTTIGGTVGRFGMSYSGTNTSGIRVQLFDEQEKEIDVKKLVEEIRKEVEVLVPDGWKLSFEVGRHGPPSGKPVEVEITGKDQEQLQKAAQMVLKKLETIPGAVDVQDDVLRGYKEFVIRVDQAKAMIRGVSPATIQRSTMSAFEGIAATKVRRADDEYEVMVLFPEGTRDSLEELKKLQLKTKFSTYISLGSIAKLEQIDSVGAIKRIDEARAVVVSASMGGKGKGAFLINQQISDYIAKELRPQFPELSFNLGGEEQERRESMHELLVLFGLAFLAIYMILSLVFQSVVYPFFVILILPFGFVGAMTALGIHGEVMSFPGMISLVGLSGIVVNDAIILVNYIRDRYHLNHNITLSVVEGGMRRIRPIFLTTFTTVVGLLPAAYQFGGSDSNMRPMALVIGWGLLIATVFTVIFIPSTMACLFELAIILKRKWIEVIYRSRKSSTSV